MSKEYDDSRESTRFLGMGKQLTWSCIYTCSTSNGSAQGIQLRGTQTGGYLFQEEGNEFTCFGTRYRAQDTPFDSKRTYIYVLEGVNPFDPGSSGIPELVDWARANCQ